MRDSFPPHMSHVANVLTCGSWPTIATMDCSERSFAHSMNSSNDAFGRSASVVDIASLAGVDLLLRHAVSNDEQIHMM